MPSGRSGFFACLWALAVAALVGACGGGATSGANDDGGTNTGAVPVLNFSDITSGPGTGLGDGLGSGAIVTVWGNNLGSSQGTSSITVGGVPAAFVYYWGNADGSKAAGPSDLYAYHKMQTIAFSVPSGAPTGTTSIQVTVHGTASNTLPFLVRTGSVYYVKSTGNDTTGNGSWSSPWRTVSYTTGLSGAAGKMSAGDILYVGDGVTESNGLLFRDAYGNAAAPYSVIAYPGALVTVVGGIGPVNVCGTAGYWNFSKMSVQSDSDGIDLTDHGRVVGNSVTQVSCADGEGGAIYAGNSNCDPVYNSNYPIIYGNYIHDFGGTCTTNLHHGTYISNRCGNPNNTCTTPAGAPDMGWNYLVNVRARFGLHVYDETACGDFVGTTKIHDNVVKDQASAGIHVAALSSHTATCMTNPIDVWNNLLINTGIDPDNKGWDQVAIEIQGAYLTSHARLYNNTVYGYGSGAGTGEGLLIQKSGNPTWGFNGSFEWVNNIVFDVHGSPYQDPSLSMTPVAYGRNLWYSSAGNPAIPSWDMDPLSSDPLFANAAAGDFSLQSGSPAKGTGATGLYPYDILGIPWHPYDIGAF